MLWGLTVVGACGEDGPTTDEIQRQQQATLLDELAQSLCTQADECGCAGSSFAAGCLGVESDLWRARVQVAHERDLEFDRECVDSIAEQAEAMACEKARAGSGHPCHDYCAVFHGDKEVGESCRRFDDLVSNCDQGLVCAKGRCTEPCEVLSGAQLGALCSASGTEIVECADGLWCHPDYGRCVLPPAPGSPCPDVGCGDDAYCEWETNTCRPRPGAGQSCYDQPCAEGLDCAYEYESDTATCVEPAALGESCQAVRCSDGLYCDETSSCRGPAELGESCNWVPCITALVCDYEFGTTCRERPAAGQACISGECEDGAVCDFASGAPSCVAAAVNGEACMGHVECASEYCPRGFCEARPGLGDDCSDLFVCAAGLSCDGSTCREATTVGPAICVYDGW